MESYAEELAVLTRGRFRQLQRGIKRLFMDMADVDLGPEDRVHDAQQKIAEVRNYLFALRQRYPQAQYPKKRFRKVYGLFAELELSCEKAEGRMQRFKNIRLRNNHSA